MVGATVPEKMREFVIVFDNRVYSFDCIGDAHSKCAECRARFGCYTGELSSRYIAKDTRDFWLQPKSLTQMVETNIFGKTIGYIVCSQIVCSQVGLNV